MDKIIKYLNVAEDYVNKLINLKHELNKESLDIQRFIYYDYMQNRKTINYYEDNALLSPLTTKYIDILNERTLWKFIHDDDKICVCSFKYQCIFNKKIVFLSKWQTGLTYNKKTKKVSFWGGNTPKGCFGLIGAMLNELKMEWFNSLPIYFRENVTKTLLENILSGKITNHEDYIKKYMKTSLKYSFHYKLIKKWFESDGFYLKRCEDFIIPKGESVLNKSFLDENIENFTFVNGSYNFDRIMLMYNIKDYTIEPNYSMQKILNGDISKNYLETLIDVFKQCRLLGEKINLHWSYNRLQEEHLKFTRKIASIRYVNADLEDVVFFGEISKPDTIECELIKNEKMAFEEGEEMHNCVYTNYWSSIKEKRYFIFRVTKPERCTLGISGHYTNNDDLKFQINQVYSKRNRIVKPETKHILNEWIETEYMQNFFNMNYKIFNYEEYLTLDIREPIYANMEAAF